MDKCCSMAVTSAPSILSGTTSRLRLYNKSQFFSQVTFATIFSTALTQHPTNQLNCNKCLTMLVARQVLTISFTTNISSPMVTTQRLEKEESNFQADRNKESLSQEHWLESPKYSYLMKQHQRLTQIQSLWFNRQSIT